MLNGLSMNKKTVIIRYTYGTEQCSLTCKIDRFDSKYGIVKVVDESGAEFLIPLSSIARIDLQNEAKIEEKQFSQSIPTRF